MDKELISLEAKLEKATLGQKAELLVNDLMLLQEEFDLIEFNLKQRRAQALKAMEDAGLKKITAQSGHNITVVESKKYDIDKDIALQVLESQSPEIKDLCVKINESKFRELFPTSEAVKEKGVSKYIKVTKG